tara:strand:- start:213 stop:1748 length:1536 start_codon:yes stop_codon:yes gene_type:complete
MKKINLILLIFLFLVSCSKESDSGQSYSPSITSGSQTGSTNSATTTTVSVPPAPYEEGDYIWKNLNSWYYWQESVANLADSKATSASSYATFINENSNPELFFESLKHPDDRFSAYTDDYDIFLDLLSGIVTSDGVEYELYLECNNQNIYGWVKYVENSSPASEVGIKRGDIFNSVNGTRLTVNNYQSLLNSNNITYGFADISLDTGCGVTSSNNISYTLNKIELNNDPIWGSAVYSDDSNPNFESIIGAKVGYLIYNQFVKENESTGVNYDQQLNNLFAQFKADNISELVIDLRFNTGGYLSSLFNLVSMITGQFYDYTFIQTEYNSKVTNQYGVSVYKFVNSLDDGTLINSLNLNRVYVLTSSNTASASENLINGLDPYIDVIQIGDSTYGKNETNIFIHANQQNVLNTTPNHKIGLYTVIGKNANSVGFKDFTDGLTPDIVVQDGVSNSEQLGSVNESLFKAALEHICSCTFTVGIEQQYDYKDRAIKLPTSPYDKILIDDIIDINIE